MQMFATSDKAPIPGIDRGQKQTKKSGYNQFIRRVCQELVYPSNKSFFCLKIKRSYYYKSNGVNPSPPPHQV